MAAKKPPARKRTAVRRKKTAPRKSVTRKPARGGFWQRRAVQASLAIAKHGEKHTATVTSRKDAAILRMTHEGCTVCKGNGQIFTKAKDGSFSGSKPCTAKPTKAKAGRMKVALAARFGPDKSSGLIGWTCPCGKKEKPRFRDAKVATKALRTHERQKHGGQTVGGAWYAQVAEGAQPAATPTKTAAPVTKTDTHTTMTDTEWEKQNTPLTPKAAEKKGLCWCCGGNGALYSAHGGERITTACPPCRGTGKPSAAQQPAAATR
jgi:hypothetical protein